MKCNYKGWAIDYNNGPYAGSQRFAAYRFGVSMRANSEALLYLMIDLRGPSLSR